MNKLFQCGVLVCLWAAGAFAVDFTALNPQGYLSDFAGVVDPAARARLEMFCEELEKRTGVQLALVTLPELAGEPVEDVANTLYRKWGVGKKGQDEGALLLLSIRDRRSRLEVGYGLEPIITDGAAGGVLRAMRPYLREERYGDALLEAAQAIGSQIAHAKGVSLEAEAAPADSPREAESPVPIALFLGGLVLFAILSSLAAAGSGRRRRNVAYGGYLPALILGNMLGRSFPHGRSGGGFGGFDSSGGFGGFGGGDSGGGGASSSW